MERKDLLKAIAKAKVPTEGPAYMLSTATLQGIFDGLEVKLTPTKEKKEKKEPAVKKEAAVKKDPITGEKPKSLKIRIIEYGEQGFPKKVIENKLREEGVVNVNYRYILMTLKSVGIKVPNLNCKGEVVIKEPLVPLV